MTKGVIILVHWHADQAKVLSSELRSNGWEVHAETGSGLLRMKAIRESLPVAAVVSLRRLPSHGREWAGALQYAGWGRAIPLIFVDGVADKVAATQKKFPDAHYCSWEELPAFLDTLPKTPVKPS